MDGLDPFPLTDLQAGYLVGASQLMELGGFPPVMVVEVDVVGLDPGRAEAALNRLIRRHEHLRTRILAQGAQRVLADDEVAPFQLPVIDLVGLDPARQEAEITRTRERMCASGPDPTGWPLFDIVAHRVRPHRMRVHLAMSLLLLDSPSVRQLQDEWWEVYRNPDAALPAVPRTFRECVPGMVDGAGTDRKHWRYWQDRLESLPDAPQLPLARPLAGINPVRLIRRTLRLDHDQWRCLGATFRQHRVLPNAGLLHAFAETLGGWASAPQFCLNVLHQNWVATHREAAGVVGQFSSTLAVEVDLRCSDDFWTRAQQLQRQLWQDMAHSDVTAVRVARELAARRGWTSRAALPYVFNSMVGPTRPARPPRRPGCRIVSTSLRTPQVLIDNQVIDGVDGGVDLVWDVVDDAFPPELPDTMFAAYREILLGLAEPAGTPWRPDPVPARHREIVAADNAPAAAAPAGRLEDGFLGRAATQPAAAAVVTSTRTLTYRELQSASAAVAAWLRGQGVGRSDVVAVVMAKGWEQVVAVLGVLGAGAAYCPVDVELPATRIRQLLDDCGARVALDQSHRAPDLAPLAVLHVDRVSEASAGPAPAPAGDPTDLAYVIYTSGSTGAPKGVMIEHRAALNTVQDVSERLGLAPADRVFGISALSFDLSVWDIFGTLGAGATLVLPDPTPRPDPVGWADTATAAAVTVWNSVPALAELLVEVLASLPERDRPPLRAVLLSGDWVPVTLPDRLRKLWPAMRITALGGATEASIWSNSYEVGQVDPAWRSIPYGRPLRNQTMRVLDHRLDLRPPWAVGQIYIGGVGLARGYWREEQRTAQRFPRHPATGERLYWTGDLGRYWPDGTIELLGREDRQLKIQGFRVEPGEIETVIRAMPGVRDCVVGGEQAPSGGQRLVSGVVAHDGAHLSAETLTEWVRARLPSYLVPGQICVVDRLQLSSNGKVDIARTLACVPAPPTGEPADAGGAAGEGSGLLAGLCRLWADLLGVAVAGPDSDFFALGGNSLLVLRLIRRAAPELGLDLPFGQIFEAATPRALATALTADDAGGRGVLGRGAAACPRSAGALTLATGAGPQLFLFHPVGGSVSSYLALARAWRGTVRAFQRRELADATTVPTALDVEFLAAGYREELRGLAPHGPYLLGGWSMGGVLAYEVGCQLAAQGHQCRVFMIDSDIENVRPVDTELARHVEFLTDLAAGRLPAEMAGALRTADGEPGTADGEPDSLARLARDAAVHHGVLPAEVDAASYQRLMRVHAANLAALATYRPPKSDLPTLLLLADAVTRADPVPAWRTVCPAVEVEVWAEDHYSIVTGRSADIAQRVQTWLHDLDRTGR